MRASSLVRECPVELLDAPGDRAESENDRFRNRNRNRTESRGRGKVNTLVANNGEQRLVPPFRRVNLVESEP